MKNATYIGLVVDRSQSISQCLEQMQVAVNEFLTGQKAVEGECELLIVDFDDRIDVVYEGSVLESPAYTIKPRGNTALHDAVGFTIKRIGKELAQREEADRPDKVMIVVITDGEENCSKKFNAADIRDLISHQEGKYNWKFDYLGANQDAVLVAQDLGISAMNSMSFCTSTAGTSNMMRSVSAKAANYRLTSSYAAYNDSDRAMAMVTDDDVKTPDLNNPADLAQIVNTVAATQKPIAPKKTSRSI